MSEAGSGSGAVVLGVCAAGVRAAAGAVRAVRGLCAAAVCASPAAAIKSASVEA
jgi:hypothetical protein